MKKPILLLIPITSAFMTWVITAFRLWDIHWYQNMGQWNESDRTGLLFCWVFLNVMVFVFLRFICGVTAMITLAQKIDILMSMAATSALEVEITHQDFDVAITIIKSQQADIERLREALRAVATNRLSIGQFIRIQQIIKATSPDREMSDA